MTEAAAVESGTVDNTVWKILVVDDEPAIHQVTKLALRNLSVLGRSSQLINALTAQDAREQLAKHPDIAVVLLDVVMETETAGLDFIKHVREQAENPLVRIILRTGQPGQAPERQVMVDYDINDYKEKTELTASKLFTSVMSSIRTFGHLQTMQGSQRAVEVMGHLNTDLFAASDIPSLVQVLVQQLEAMNLFSSVTFELDNSATLAAPLARPTDDHTVVLALPNGQNLHLHMVASQLLSAQSLRALELWVQSVSAALSRWNA